MEQNSGNQNLASRIYPDPDKTDQKIMDNPNTSPEHRGSLIWRVLFWLITLSQIISILFLTIFAISGTDPHDPNYNKKLLLFLFLAIISNITGQLLLRKGITIRGVMSIILIITGLILSLWLIVAALHLNYKYL